MKTQTYPQTKKNQGRLKLLGLWQTTAIVAVAACIAATKVSAATVLLYTNNFDSYSGAATSFSSPAVTFPPTGAGGIRVEDGVAQGDASYAIGWNGVQLINWAPASAHNSGNCMLLRPNTSFRCTFDPRGGSNYVWEFSMLSSRAGVGGGARSYRMSLVQQGADQNAHDFVIFRGNQGGGIATDDRMEAFDGRPGKTWTILTNNSSGLEYSVASGVWHHYKFVANAVNRTFDLYVDGVLTSTNYSLSRPQNLTVSEIRFASEASGGGTGAGDYIMIDNVSLQADGNFIDLASGNYTDGFESYTASTSANTNTANNNPGGPWVTAETDGVENGKAFAPDKVEVVDGTVTTAHSGSKCLMVSQSQTAGSTISWAPAPNEDVRITWWAKVAGVTNSATLNPDAVYLRVSVYGWEADFSAASDTMLFGYGHRASGFLLPNTGTGTTNSIITFNRWFGEWFFGGNWGDTLTTYTPDTWEEYQLTTNVKLNSYTLIKNPSGTPVVVVKNGHYISPWGNNKKIHTLAFSTSNQGTAGASPPAFVDDVTVEPYTNTDPIDARPYNISGTGPAARFTNYTVLTIPGKTIGGVTVDPTDNTSIIFTIDEEVNGQIRRATKVASGNWVIDPTPIVSGLYNPNTCVVETNGTLWWVHDAVKGGQPSSLRRLKQPWATSPVEEVISDFGVAPTNRQDQACDLVFVPTSFSGTYPQLAVLDRGVNAVNEPNAIWLVDPATATLNQQVYANSLIAPNNLTFGAGLGGNANGIAALPSTGELLTIWEDGTGNTTITNTDDCVIMAFDGAGASREISLRGLGLNMWGAALAVDPTTSRIWFTDRVNTVNPSAFNLPRILSVDSATVAVFPWETSTNTSLAVELTFPNIAPTADRPDRHIDFKDPGMAFSTNGSFLVVSDQSPVSGGSRMIIFHSEAFTVTPITITSVTRTGGNANLVWTSGGAVNYEVQRSATVNGTYVSISGVLTGTSYTDTSAPAGAAFYRVVAFPQN